MSIGSLHYKSENLELKLFHCQGLKSYFDDNLWKTEIEGQPTYLDCLIWCTFVILFVPCKAINQFFLRCARTSIVLSSNLGKTFHAIINTGTARLVKLVASIIIRLENSEFPMW